MLAQWWGEKEATAGWQQLQSLMLKSRTADCSQRSSLNFHLILLIQIVTWFRTIPIDCNLKWFKKKKKVFDLPKIWTALPETENMIPSGQIGHGDGRLTAKCQILKVNTPAELVQVWRPWWRRGFADSEWWMMMMNDAVSASFKSCHHFILKPLTQSFATATRWSPGTFVWLLFVVVFFCFARPSPASLTRLV